MALDRNTGQPVGNTGLAATIGQSTGQLQVTAPTTTTTSGTSSSSDKTSAAVSSASSSINTTPGALAALEQLITQLTDRPNISDAELNAKFPMPTRQFHPNLGWAYVDPRSGQRMTNEQAQTYMTQMTAKREQATKEAGTIAGGTEEQKLQQGQRQEEIANNRKTQQGYSKDAAMSDANFLIQKSIADALEAALPQISAGLEGAGTSKSTLAAAATQKAATKGATEGAALGAQLSTAYGGINNQLASTLEMLTRSDPNSPTAMLLQTIIGSKGLVSSGVQNQVQSGQSDKAAVTNNTANASGQVQATDAFRLPLGGATGMPSIAQPSVATKTEGATNPYYAFAVNERDQSAFSPSVITTDSAEELYGS